jgi:Kef-type K+ transport system membrane component KefB
MLESVSIDALLVALVGGAVVASTILTSLCTRLGIPPLVGHLLLGVVARPLGDATGILTEPVLQGFRLLADLVIVALLFSVGLHSNPRALAAKLPEAVPIWLGNVLTSAALTFVAVLWWLDLSVVAALLCATALTATSVGVAVALWQEAGRLPSPEGDLLVDVAELDDLSAMALMAVTFAILPALALGNGVEAGAVGAELSGFLLRFALFVSFCVFFTLRIERHVTQFALNLPQPPERMLLVAGVGFLIAAVAELLGFSLAIGALAAGLVFSRDPEAVHTEASFRDLYAFITPFFFIGIGLHVAPETLLGALPIAAVLFGVAVVGKVLGTFVPALVASSAAGALLLGLSMVPRAEIALVVFDQGRQRAPEFVGPELYSAGVLVALATCVFVPLLLGPLLRRPRGPEAD